MSKGPEANFWNSLRAKLPKKCAATRLENRHGGGVPDLHIMWDGIDVWMELKVGRLQEVTCDHKPDSPSDICDHNFIAHYTAQILRDSQRSWHARHFAAGGLSFVLVRDPSRKCVVLLRPVLGAKGLILGQIWAGKSLGLMFEALRPCALAHLSEACGPAG